jgi:hypothetical protein
MMRRVPHSWRKAYELALIESDPIKLIGRIEYAMYALERRHSEWETDPGTPAELAAIQKCIAALARLMKRTRLGTSAVTHSTSARSSSGTQQNVPENQGPDADFPSGVSVA